MLMLNAHLPTSTHTPTTSTQTAFLHAIFAMEDGQSLTNPLFTSISALKRQLLLSGRLEAQAEGDDDGQPPPPLLLRLLHVDFLYALIRLAARLASSSDDTTEAAAAVQALLQRAAGCLDLQTAWQEAAAAASGGIGQQQQPQPAAWAWAARRLLVRAEAAALEALLLLPSPVPPPASLRAQARRLLPLCAPGQEWEAWGLLLRGLEDGETQTLPKLFTSVLADPTALAQGRLLVGDRAPSPARGSLLLAPWVAARPPHTLLPLPPHWLLLPLASSLAGAGGQQGPEQEEEQDSSSGIGTTTRILRATMYFLLRDEDVWPSYTALLPPGLPLYYLLCLGLFPYEAFTGETGREVGCWDRNGLCFCFGHVQCTDTQPTTHTEHRLRASLPSWAAACSSSFRPHSCPCF